MKKIKWKRLFKAMQDSLILMLSLLTVLCIIILPFALTLATNQIWWLAFYALVIFIGHTWENYNDNDE